MKYAIFSDVHSNLEALTAVLEDMEQQGYDRVVSLGDVVGYGPNPNECFDTVSSLAHVQRCGNHDVFVAHKIDSSFKPPFSMSFNAHAEWGAEKNALYLVPPHREAFMKFARSEKYTGTENGIIFAHSTPLHPEQMNYIFGPREARDYFFEDPTIVREKTIAFVGHIHVPQNYYLHQDGKIRGGQITFNKQITPTDKLNSLTTVPVDVPVLIVVPSVGQPRDGIPLAGYALYDTVTRKLETRRVPYDIAATQRKMAALKGCPQRLIDRLAEGR